MGRVEGKVALVTGAASGIGLSAATLMAQEGAKVVLADLNEAAAQQAAARIREAGGQAQATTLNATERASVQAAVDFTAETFGGLNIMVNNVGGNRPDTDLDTLHITDEAWDFALLLNATATLYGCQAALPHLLAAGGGSIVNTASMAHRGGDLVRIGYTAGKAAVVAMTRSMAAQYGKQGVRCNSVSPGLVLTPAAEQHLPQAFKDMWSGYNAVPDVGRPDDIGYTILFLASDEARHITGQNIEVDGGHFVSQPTNPAMRVMYQQMAQQAQQE
ncbi:SDR family NAD(P)-dependent oxidoreductase [Deinococcus radiophilus]|uniref:SDR family oxidoreductase n=1 Tax=Deinococcus radiophilus TaxID=32062 RepID=A0A431VPS1_9DEIO|nr:SDR family oxidoreductase [Deinococcus radiophilus]RTR25200.1 SDR family oxidoreductase [Deinococcus radiophilus]UFA51825.1 SDR family oxidoreductase [Deinococcus radiophilus]